MAQDDAKFTPFTTRMRCGVCGGPLRRATQPSRTAPDGRQKYWRCVTAAKCDVKGIREEVLEQICVGVLDISEFDGDAFRERVDHIDVFPGGRLEFHLTDGSHVCAEYSTKRKGTPWSEEQRAKFSESVKKSYTPERRQAMSENMKRIRKESTGHRREAAMGTIRKIENSGLPSMMRKRVAATAAFHGIRKDCCIPFPHDQLLLTDQKNPEWEYAGVYADEAYSTSMDSERIQQTGCGLRSRKIDIILTKSISRFARNTVDLLETVRRLKALGVEVRFEEQNISTLSGDGELMLTILASFAQEESISQSNNICWAKRKIMEAGEMTNTAVPYGYRYNPDTRLPEVVPEQAEIIRDIFRWYIEEDQSVYTISKRLNAAGIPSPRDAAWTQAVVRRMLRNETYTGNMMLGKFYSDGPLTQRHTKNYGERPMFFAEETHEAVIDTDTFRKVQERMAYNREYGCFRGGTMNSFTGKVICGVCGQTFRRATIKREKGNKYPAWTCKKRAGEAAKCRVVTIMESDLETISAGVLGLDSFSPAVFEEQIDTITVTADDRLLFRFRDGRSTERYYPRRRKLRSEGKQNG